MFYDGPPGLMVDLAKPSPNGVDLLYSDEYVAARMETNPYVYARNNPLKYVDPSGLGVTAEQKCKNWGAAEAIAGLAWLAGLPNCPCNIGCLVNPNSAVWYDPEKAGGLHPGADTCIRSIPANPCSPGQQCCYDKSGALITGGLAAGTPDKIAPSSWYCTIQHGNIDVVPFNWCNLAGLVPGVYLVHRPPNNGNNCAANVV